MVDADFLREHIDFTCLRPDVSISQIKKFCFLAKKFKVKTIYLAPIFVRFAHELLDRQNIQIGTVAGFPYGNIDLQIKAQEISQASRNGASWVDVVMNISNVKSCHWKSVEQEIKYLAEVCAEKRVGLKLIIETPYLTREEIKRVTKIIDSQNISYIKTATGVGTKVELNDVKLIKSLLTRANLKAAGGIKTFYEAIQFFNAGADLIGSSKGFEILQEFYNSKC